jgi:MoaA/NifB/PqqE/SkfB family radical SAM enzyme
MSSVSGRLLSLGPLTPWILEPSSSIKLLQSNKAKTYMIEYLKEIIPKIPRYYLARIGAVRPGLPINLTFSVTNHCQSRCNTCKIWERYRQHPEKAADEMSITEIDRTFRSMGHVYIFNISGGEPFLRNDLPDIVRSACRHLTPGIIHIPTNAISGRRVERQVLEILDFLKRLDSNVRLTIKPSLDHIGSRHDEIRGVPGNFEKVIALYNRLLGFREGYPQLHVELGTVISTWNVADIEAIADYITGLGCDGYRHEIAEQRAEMFNQNDPITPSPADYDQAIDVFIRKIRERMQNRNLFLRITNAFRLVYYSLAARTLREDRQVIPCYAGISNVHMNPYGEIWACCTLGYNDPMGNLREFDYDFPRLWNSESARRVREKIRGGQCACPLANQLYSNILLHPPTMLRVLREILAGGKSH